MGFVLIIILAVLGIMLLIGFIASIIKWRASRLTFWFSIKKLEIQQSMQDYARLLLDERGLVDVEVERAGFFASIFVGNTYSVSKRKIRLGYFTAKRARITNLAIVCKLVGLAKMHNDGEKNLRAIELNRWLSWLPIIVLPLILIGLIIDLVGANGSWMYTIITSAIGIGITGFCFIISLIAIKKEFKAYNVGRDMINEIGILNEDEENKMKKLIGAWKALALLNVLIVAFELLFFMLKLIFSVFKLGRK